MAKIASVENHFTADVAYRSSPILKKQLTPPHWTQDIETHCELSKMTVNTMNSGKNIDIDAPDFSNEVILKIINYVGDIKCSQRDFESAYSLYDHVYQIRRNFLNEHQHHDTIMALFNAGKCLHCLGKVNTAHRYHDLFRRLILSSPHPDILTKDTILALQSIAWMYHQQRSLAHSKTFYELALRFAIKVFGKSHTATARILNQYGNLNFELGHMNLALQCYKEGLVIENTLSASGRHYQDLDILTTLSNIAQIYELVGNPQESLRYYLKSIGVLRSNRGEMSQRRERLGQAADVLSNIARLQCTMGRPNHALRAFTDALRIQRQAYDNNHIAVAITLNEMGVIYGAQGKTQLSLQCFEESIRIRQSCSNDPLERDISPVLFNIARCYLQKGDCKRAIVQYEKVVNIEMRKRADRDRDLEWSPEVLLDALEHMANICHSKLGEPQKALGCYEKGVHIFMELGPEVVPLDTQSRFLGSAGNICLELGIVDKAVRLLSETMRVNLAAGWRFNSNIKTSGFDFSHDISQLPRGAPAA